MELTKLSTDSIDKVQDEVTKAYDILTLIKRTIEYENGHVKDATMFYQLGFTDSYAHHIKRATINRLKRERLIKYFNHTVMELSL